MVSFVQMMTEKDAFTQNGALTNSTSHNYCLDLFFLAGACRNVSEEDIELAISKSYSFDPLKTRKIIFWAGDIRMGAGERRFFKIGLNWLNKNHPDDIQNNLENIPEFSRWDVIFDMAIENEIVFSYLLTVLSNKEHKLHGLLCKWLPRKIQARDVHKHSSDETYTRKDKFGNSVKCYSTSSSVSVKKRLLYNGLAAKLRKRLGLSPKQYRKMLVEGSKTVEQQMCKKQWSEIVYEHVPSVAMNKYRKAWYRNDQERFEQYLEDVKSGKSKMNASAIFPHDILGDAIGYNHVGRLTESQIVQWSQLPDWFNGQSSKMIPVVDTSGSMTWENNALALRVALGLGLYISERNQGLFKDAFITFSDDPKFFYVSGNIDQRCQQVMKQRIGGWTDIEAVFHLILQKAIINKLPQNEMPETILIISDMEFNAGTTGTRTTQEVIEKMYMDAGYRCPRIIYWNVNGRPGNVPITINNYGAGLISGASPSILKSVLTGKMSPVDIMDETIESERYSLIK